MICHRVLTLLAVSGKPRRTAWPQRTRRSQRTATAHEWLTDKVLRTRRPLCSLWQGNSVPISIDKTGEIENRKDFQKFCWSKVVNGVALRPLRLRSGQASSGSNDSWELAVGPSTRSLRRASLAQDLRQDLRRARCALRRSSSYAGQAYCGRPVIVLAILPAGRENRIISQRPPRVARKVQSTEIGPQTYPWS